LATKPEEPGSCSAGEECRVEADFGTFGAGCVPLPPDDDLPAEARNETDCKFDVRIDDDGELDRERLASVSTPLDIDLLFTLDTLVNAALAGAPSPCVLDEEEWEEEGVAVFECEGLASFTDGFLESAIIDQGIPGEDDGMTAELTVTPENGIAFSIGQPSSILNFNSTAFGVISGTGDEGHHSISGVSAGDLLTLETETPNSLLDSTLELVDVEGKQVAFNDDFFGVNSFISINAPGDGEYTAIVRGYPGGIFGPGVSTGSYSLIIDLIHVVEVAPIMADTVVATECVVAPGSSVTGFDPTLDIEEGEPTNICTYEWEREEGEQFVATDLNGAQACTRITTRLETSFESGSCASGGVDSCGGQSPESCWCDTACIQFGDCCPDVVAVCDGSSGFDRSALNQTICRDLVAR
jgi:hypothetical protein